jgi:beta-1,4-glucuronyltransferase 1
VKLYKEKYLVWFHMFCPKCQWHDNTWMDAENDSEIKIFGSFKRMGKFEHTEPLFIGTNDEPLYDERLSWEGKFEKMSNAYILCLLDYNFNVLNNAFLVHKPGIKQKSGEKSAEQLKLERSVRRMVQTEISREIKSIYGERKGCVL